MTKILFRRKADALSLDQWIAALRSGKYTQGKNRLRTDHRDENGVITRSDYCCLGVLCEEENRKNGPYFYGDYTSYPIGKRWAGLKTTVPVPLMLKHTSAIANPLDITVGNLNDIGGATFEQIADYLEQYFEDHVDVSE